MGLFDSVAPIAGIALGALGGAQGDRKTGNSTSGMDLAPETALEKNATGNITDLYNQMQGMVSAGAGQSDVTAALGSQRDLASMLSGLTQSGGIPGQSDINAANSYASQIFAPQQTAMSQAFQDQQTQAQRLAAQLNRPVNDPIIQAKLAQEQTRQQAMLQSQQGAFGAEYAQGLPQQRLGYASQLSDVRNNLASQAMANRQALLSLGQNLRNDDRQFRMGTAQRWTNDSQNSGGGLSGALGGALAGAGAGASIAGMFGGGSKGAPSIGGGSSGASMPSLTMPSFGASASPASFGLGSMSPTRSIASRSAPAPAMFSSEGAKLGTASYGGYR